MSFDPPASAISEYEARRAAKGDDSDLKLSDSDSDDSDDEDAIASGYSTSKMFWDHATDHLIATELQDTPIPDEIYREMEKMFEGWELERRG